MIITECRIGLLVQYKGKTSRGLSTGARGKIRVVSNYEVGVEFENIIKGNGSTLDGRCEAGKGWWFNARYSHYVCDLKNLSIIKNDNMIKTQDLFNSLF